MTPIRGVKQHTARWSVLVLFAVLTGVAARPAQAHWADQAVAEIVLAGEEARITLTFPTGLAAFADTDHDGRLSTDEMRVHRRGLEAIFRERLHLSGGVAGSAARAVPGALRIEPATATELPRAPAGAPGTHSAIVLTYRWPRPPQTLTIRYDLFVPGVPTASCLATVVRDGQTRSVVFTPEHREVVIAPHRTVRETLPGFIVLGIRHILTGYDHVLFLLSLLVAGGSLRSFLKIITAFTAAHSITLSLAALNVVSLPGRLVESAIALSIAYVALENLVRGSAVLRSRWLVTFGFGLVHGLGFASILRAMDLSRSGIALSLLGFNLGVEIGQVALVAAAFLCLSMLRRFAWMEPARRWASAGAAMLGIAWFVQRAFLNG